MENNHIFTDYERKLEDTKANAAALHEQLSLCRVVRESYIDNKLSSLLDTVDGIVEGQHNTDG